MVSIINRYVLDRTRDQVKTKPGRDSTDPYIEEMYWSGLGYRLEFSWKVAEQSWSDPPPSIEFYLLAAQSKGPVRLQLRLRGLRLH